MLVQNLGKWNSKLLFIVRALYGLRSNSSIWHQKFSDNLQNIGFKQYKADYDLWMRDCKGHCEYIAVMVDDILFIGNDSESIIGHIRSIYCFKIKGILKCMVLLLKLEAIPKKMKLNLFIQTKFIFIKYTYGVHNGQLHKEDLTYNMKQVYLSVLHNNQGKDTKKRALQLVWLLKIQSKGKAIF